MGLAGIINITMLVVAAQLFHDSGRTGVDSIEGAHAGFNALLGGGAALAFAVALLASGLSSSSVGTFAGQVVMQGFINRRIPLFVRRAITMAPSLVILAIGVNPSTTLVISQVVLSFGIPFALVPMVLLTRRADIMGALVNRRLTTVVASIVAGDDHLPQRASSCTTPSSARALDAPKIGRSPDGRERAGRVASRHGLPDRIARRAGARPGASSDAREHAPVLLARDRRAAHRDGLDRRRPGAAGRPLRRERRTGTRPHGDRGRQRQLEFSSSLPDGDAVRSQGRGHRDGRQHIPSARRPWASRCRGSGRSSGPGTRTDRPAGARQGQHDRGLGLHQRVGREPLCPLRAARRGASSQSASAA